MSDKNTELLNIASYCGNYKQEGNGYLCKCPCHDDTKPSLLLNLSPNNKIIAYCRAGCDWKTILDHFKSKGLMLDEQKKNTSKDIITDTYIYESSIGDVVFEKQRLEPEYMKDSGIKRFLYRRKLPNSNKYSYKDVIKSLPSTIPVPLYKLPRIFKASTIYLCEGEKDVKTLSQYLTDDNTTATCNHDGAGKWLPHYNTWLKGKTIIILQDNDDSGERHTALLTEHLADICKLYLVKFDQYKDNTHPRKYDTSDFIRDYGYSAFQEHVNNTMQLVTRKGKLKELEKAEKAEKAEKKEKEDSGDETKEIKKIPKASYDDYVALIKRTLGTYGKDIFSNKVLTLSDGIWQSAIDLIPILRSEAAMEEEAGIRRYNRPLIEDHFHKWSSTLTPRFLVDIPQWDGILS